jgi:hypothetical protein
MKKIILTFSILVNILIASAQEIKYTDSLGVANALKNDGRLYTINDSVSYLYSKPKQFSYIKHSLEDLYLVPKVLFKKESIKSIIGVAASTALLIAFDEDITRASQRFGSYVGLSHETNDKNISPFKGKISGADIYVPSDFSTALYYIGDGYTELSVNAGFYIYGLITKDQRARQTASQLSEGMIATGIYVQIFKHLTGRTTARKSGGEDIWRPFPSWKEYYSSVPKYDAFYSGHLTTAMMTTTVIALNYPEKKFVKPLCYTLMALCGYQMINNGVHWAGDYPMAIGMGYVIGKIAVNRGRMKVARKENAEDIDRPTKKLTSQIEPVYKLKPAYLGFGASGLRFTATF